jgi:hypothetical protein
MSSSLPAVVRSGGVTKAKAKAKAKTETKCETETETKCERDVVAKDSGLRSFVPDDYDAPKLSPPAPVLG